MEANECVSHGKESELMIHFTKPLILSFRVTATF